jgi:small subunit ribosomal protein S20
MANHKSAEKRSRQNVNRRARNRAHRSRLRNQIKKLRQAVETGEVDTARGLLRPTLSLVDRSVQKGVLHDRAAARTKSRLVRLLNRPTATT